MSKSKVVSSLGVLAFFRGREVWVEPTAARATLAAHGFDEAIAPDLDPVQRARASAPEFRARTGTPSRVECVRSDADSAAFGVLYREEVVAGSEVRWAQRDAVEFDRSGGWSSPATAEGVAFVAHASRLQRCLDYRWLRDRFALPQLLALGAFPVATGSGVYYVPDGDSESLGRVREVVRACGRSELHVVRVAQADEDTRAAVGAAAQDHVLAQAEDVVARLAAWREKARGRTTTLDGMLDDLKALSDRAVLLSTALQFSTDEIDAALDAATADVRKALADAPPAPPPRASVVLPDGARGVAAVPATVEALQAIGGPAHANAIAAKLCEMGIATTAGTPYDPRALHNNLWGATHRGEAKDTAPVVQVGPRTWALRDATAAVAQPAAPEPATDPEPVAPEPESTVADPETVVEPEPVEPDAEETFPSVEALETMGKADLIKWCKRLGIKGYSKMTGVQRMAAILALRESAA